MSLEKKISAIVPVGDRYDSTGQLAQDYCDALEATGESFELIYVIDGENEAQCSQILEFAGKNAAVRVIKLAKNFGEATAVTAGFEVSRGEILMTLPAYYQIEATAIADLLAALEHCDMAVGARSNRAVASGFEQKRREVFHWLVQRVGGDNFTDLGCNARAMQRNVLEEVPLYGDQHRFMPLLAARRGFKVHEIAVPQSENDRYAGTYGANTYLRRLLDIFTVFFLVRFTKKPLRFFGMVGSVTFAVGAVVLLFVVAERLFFGTPLADRPVLLLSSLFVVLGLQLFALGLLGELIIFTHARDIKEYTIEQIVN